MSATVVVGLQYGDEGKGKIVDWLAHLFKVIVRYNGGPNAGHTVVNDRGEFKLHQVPSGIFNPEALCYLASGAVVDPVQLYKELDMLASRGVDTSRFRLSGRAHVIMPWHLLIDQLSEVARGDRAIGTTGRGIGPCYADKVSRTGMSVRDALERGLSGITEEASRRAVQLQALFPQATASFPWVEDPARLIGFLNELSNTARIADTDALLREAWKRGEAIMLEGAQGTMIDLHYGTYPYVSSSSSSSAGACIGSGLPPTAIEEVIGIAKAYATRVGAGPFPTELGVVEVERLRRIGKEFGTTTGRPRRCGWFDAVDVRYAAAVNGATSVVLTKLDVLSSYERIGVGVDRTDTGEVVYEYLPGWREPIDDATRWRALPASARRYVARLEELIGVPITHVATGPSREAIIKR